MSSSVVTIGAGLPGLAPGTLPLHQPPPLTAWSARLDRLHQIPMLHIINGFRRVGLDRLPYRIADARS
jgi:hypothetical protein